MNDNTRNREKIFFFGSPFFRTPALTVQSKHLETSAKGGETTHNTTYMYTSFPILSTPLSLYSRAAFMYCLRVLYAQPLDTKLEHAHAHVHTYTHTYICERKNASPPPHALDISSRA